MLNLTPNVVTKRLSPDGTNLVVAAGTGDTLTSPVIDTLGFNGFRLLMGVGTLTTTAVTTVNLQSCDTAGGTYTDVAGSTQVIADDQDNKLIILEVDRPKKRFFKLVTTRAVANAVIDTLILEMHTPNNAPVTQDATVSGAPIVLNSPN